MRLPPREDTEGRVGGPGPPQERRPAVGVLVRGRSRQVCPVLLLRLGRRRGVDGHRPCAAARSPVIASSRKTRRSSLTHFGIEAARMLLRLLPIVQ